MNEDAITYDSSTGRYHADFAVGEPDSVADAVVHGVAEILDRDPVTLPPLGSVVDTDSLNAVFRSADDSSVSVSFEYSGVVVIVHGHGRISFEEGN